MPGDLLDGAEPYRASSGPDGVLLLHGLTGTPHALRRLGYCLADAGLSVELPLLPGHGTNVEDLAQTGFEDWAAAAEEAYDSLVARCDRVVVGGLSMGGTLACQLAERHEELAGLFLVNPFMQPPAPSALEALRAGLASGVELLPGIASDIASSGVEEVAYGSLPVAALISLLEASGEVASGLRRICCPVLLFSSRVDHVVLPESSDLVEHEVGGPVERVVLERSYHVATLDHDAGEIEERVVGFVQKVLA
jgi:carboxylesterase